MVKSKLAVPKTYKLYIGGKFPRTESGRYLTTAGPLGSVHYCRASRKDFRNAVVSARDALTSWSEKTAYNRGQILYRIAEILEGRKAQLVDELRAGGATLAGANKEVEAALDCIIYYAGWSDKYQQVFSSVNPVASSYFNFSVHEPMGIVTLICPTQPSLLGLVSAVLPVVVGGNTCVALASEDEPLTSISLSEILHTSDVPGGVVNVLTGQRSELFVHMAGHMDVNALVIYDELATEEKKVLAENAGHNMKRVIQRSAPNFGDSFDPYFILDTQELKTTWHPVGK